MQAIACEALQGVLPSEAPPHPDNGIFHPETWQHAKRHPGPQEAGGGAGWGHYQMGGAEDQGGWGIIWGKYEKAVWGRIDLSLQCNVHMCVLL